MTSKTLAGLFAEYLDQVNGSINLVFHDIVRASEQQQGNYDVRLGSFTEIVDRCRRLGIAGRVRLYFDDNHRSLYDVVIGEVDVRGFQDVVAAVPVTSLDKDGRGTRADLEQARSTGVRVVPHGYSHVRLASYDSWGNLQPTPLGGPYADSRAAGRRLSENEVLFQLIESREAFDQDGPAELVLPYGCYNRTTLALNERLGLYDVLATSDFEIDLGQQTRPRLLVAAVDTADDVERRILKEVTAT
jgi:hypothetical protein